MIGGGADEPAFSAIHVWWARLGESDALAARWQDVLDSEEREQRQRFRNAESRDLYALAHVLLRVALSRHAAVKPQAWSFVRGAYGKPELTPSLAATTRLHFSLAHSAATAVCAIRWGAPVGVDVEPIDRSVDPLELAAGVLSCREKEALLAVEEEEMRRRRFLALWTLKEAYVKAVGLGLTFSVTDCIFDLGQPGVRFASHVADNPADWWFDHVLLDERDLISVAARRYGSMHPAVRYSHWCRSSSRVTSNWEKRPCGG